MTTKSDSLQSRVLSAALDKIGANQCIRMKYRERNALQLIGYEFYWMNEEGVSYLTKRRIQEKFGSFIEGTTTPGLKSDRDDIFIEYSDLFEEGSEETKMVYEKPVIVVADKFTPPGFIKLRIDGRRNWKSFELKTCGHGISFLTNIYTEGHIRELKNLVQFGEALEQNGPALTFYFTDGPLESVDILSAFHNRTILSFNLEFFNRKRRYGWPSKRTIATMKNQGCLFVPTGHRLCAERERVLQWRISFSFQERLIMFNLNDAQYNCYILMKLVKKSHISPLVGLTSYHCKTALFYTIENNAEDIWRNDNLLNCFISCLMRLKRWSKKRFCPSYFIPEVNLFTGKMDEQELKKLTNVLAEIIKNPRCYIEKIPTDDFGKLVQLYETNADDDEIIEKANTNAAVELQAFFVDTSSMFFRIRTTILRKIAYRCKTASNAIYRHLKWLNTLHNLQEKNKVAHLQLDDIRWALPHLSKFLHTSVACHLALKALETNDQIVKSWLTLTATFHFWMGLGSDATSSKIKLAAVLFYTGNIDVDTLKSHYRVPADARPLCDCRFKREDKRPLCDAIKNLYMSSPQEVMEMCTSTFIEKYISACTIFLPTEAKITPYPLLFEMHRDFGCVFSPQEEYVEKHYKMSSVDLGNCATIDSTALCILMTALLSNEQERNVYIDLLASTPESLPHHETTLNVCGWFASAENINLKSLLFYKQSWDYHVKLKQHTQPVRMTTGRNAAKWHLALLLFRAWTFHNNKQRLPMAKY